MRSLDANIALRLLLADHPHQEHLARQVLSEPAMLLSTVVLETAWVLTGKGWSRGQIVAAFRALLDLEHLYVPDEAALVWVIERFEDGGDFADMLHVALSDGASAFVTFDRKVERYCRDGPVPVETLG